MKPGLARRVLRWAALLACGVAVLMTAVVLDTGGFEWRSGGLRISVRSALHPVLLTIVSALGAWLLTASSERKKALKPNGLAVLATAAIALAATEYGLTRGLFVAAGADAYGYVSQADLWAKGSPIVHQPFAAEMTWPNAAATLAPLGYRPAPLGTDIVPTYAPGLPLIMALFRIAGGAQAVYVVVPVLGALAIVATYLLGLRLAGPLVGVCAAMLLGSSPTFLFEVVSPTSDVPATAWFALALALMMYERRIAFIAAGAAAGLGILTRPNLVPVALVPGIFLMWRAFRHKEPFDRAIAFAAGCAPFCFLVAAINAMLYGSPLASGYGALRDLYDWSFLAPNLARYPRWVIDSQTAAILLAIAGPFVLPRTGSSDSMRAPRAAAIMWLVFAAAVVVPYLFYLVFEEWWYVRFLMPAYPVLLILVVVVVSTLMAPLERFARGARATATVLVSAMLAWHGVTYAFDRGAHVAWVAEQRYLEVGQYVAHNLPERAALICMQHSGGARFYSNRLTVRYDLIAPTDLELVIANLRQLGYQPYVVLDDWEEPIFRTRFEAHTPLGRLDWLPIAAIHRNQVRIYDTADRLPES